MWLLNLNNFAKSVVFATISVALQVAIVWMTQAVRINVALPYLRFISMCYSILE